MLAVTVGMIIPLLACATMFTWGGAAPVGQGTGTNQNIILTTDGPARATPVLPIHHQALHAPNISLLSMQPSSNVVDASLKMTGKLMALLS
jgi:hypothetical protein